MYSPNRLLLIFHRQLCRIASRVYGSMALFVVILSSACVSAQPDKVKDNPFRVDVNDPAFIKQVDELTREARILEEQFNDTARYDSKGRLIKVKFKDTDIEYVYSNDAMSSFLVNGKKYSVRIESQSGDASHVVAFTQEGELFFREALKGDTKLFYSSAPQISVAEAKAISK
jgi:hypothetical protein